MSLPFTLTLSDLADPVLIIGVAFAVAYWIAERADAREWREKRRQGFPVEHRK